MKNPISPLKKMGLGLARTIRGMFRSKYIEIILAVALFILLDTGVLVLNFYTSYQIADDAHAIHLVSRMGTYSQQLLHELYQVQEDVADPRADYGKTIDVLAETYKVFDETLDAFIYGGELIGVGQGKDALLKDTVYRDTSADLLTKVETIWKEYRYKLQPIVYAYFNDSDREDISRSTIEAISYARQKSDTLLQLMRSFSVAVEGVAKRKAERLRMIQSVGIGLAVINFLLILFHIIKRLNASDTLIEKSRRETEDILENVNEGLFLLDREFTIGSQHSKSLHDLFKKEKLAGHNFIDLLSRLVSEKTLNSVVEYTEILFSPRVNESLITDLNPLDNVEIHLSMDDAVFDLRYFSFQFARVYEKKEFNTLLVTVKDITEQVQLAEQLKAANEKSSKEIEMLLTIIHVDGSMLTDFLESTEEGLTRINKILKKKAKRVEHLQNKLASISRIVHKLKGDSTAIGLDSLVEKFHRFEDLVTTLNEKRNLTGEDFLPLVVYLKQLIADFVVIANLQEKMTNLTLSGASVQKSLPSVNNPAGKANDPIWDSHWKSRMTTLVESVARDYEKQAILDLSDFNASLLAERQTEPVTDIIVQSLRNAVVHGLETPVLRESAGKPREGKLKVALNKNGGGLQLTIRDDGQGIDLDKIKAVALAKGLVTEGQVTSMQRSKLLWLIFQQGFTTVDENGVHAGRGVGMDLIKSRVESLNGQIKLKFQKGEYTEFQYSFNPETAEA